MLRHRHTSTLSNNTPSNENVVQATKLLSKIDLYPKVQKEYRVKTKTGGQVSVITGVIMLVLFCNEVWVYLQTPTIERMYVDTSIEEKLRINYDISFYALPCKSVDINAMDVAGELQINMHNNMKKTRIDSKYGKPIQLTPEEIQKKEEMKQSKKAPLPKDYCGSCYGASTRKCCNTCEDVRNAYADEGWNIAGVEGTEQCQRESFNEEILSKDGEGCRIQGFMHVNRVFGNFHVALGQTIHRNGNLVHQFSPGEQFTYNASHFINHLSFGGPIQGKAKVEPLDNTGKIASYPGMVYQYFLNIVPTIYIDSKGQKFNGNQFAYTQHSRRLEIDGPMNMLPGLFFVFDFAQFIVQVEEKPIPFGLFLTRICAIIGGMYTIASVVDSILHHYGRTFTQAKRETATKG